MLILMFVVDDVVGGVIGNFVNGQIINDNCFMLNGIVEVGSVVSIYDGDILFGVILVNVSGVWSFMLMIGLNDGMCILIVIVIDLVGNVSLVISGFIIVVDIFVLMVLFIISIVDDVLNNIGVIGNG